MHVQFFGVMQVYSGTFSFSIPAVRPAHKQVEVAFVTTHEQLLEGSVSCSSTLVVTVKHKFFALEC